MSLVVRRARPQDADTLAAMCARLAEEQGDGAAAMTAARVRADGFGPQAAFTALLGHLDEGPAGYLIFCPHYDTDMAVRGLYVCDLYVEPWARRRGVARTLMATTARTAATQGGRYLVWNVGRANTAARGFYRSLGRELGDLLTCWTGPEAFDRLCLA